MITVSVLCFVSLVGNYFLWQSKQQYKDDALKFRIIRVWRGCSPKKILCLSDVLDIHRDATIFKESRSRQKLNLVSPKKEFYKKSIVILHLLVDSTLLKEEKISPLFYSSYKNIYYICKQSDDIYGKSN